MNIKLEEDAQDKDMDKAIRYMTLARLRILTREQADWLWINVRWNTPLNDPLWNYISGCREVK